MGFEERDFQLLILIRRCPFKHRHHSHVSLVHGADGHTDGLILVPDATVHAVLGAPCHAAKMPRTGTGIIDSFPAAH